MIVGTAGHIDHGKTALVRALTGVDTDRLPEEKRRGITIDLGFAPLTLPNGQQLGVVDVPGHEAFVRTMLAGASGIDLALLVIAADEGPMPQTREHLAILELLQVPALIVALTKSDLVEPDWLALVADDIRTLLKTTRYAGATVIPTSVVRSSGVDELRSAIATHTAQFARTVRRDVFRLPIDRVFSVKGTGTVVTGTAWSGELALIDSARIMPLGTTVRLRGLQSHGASVEKVVPGTRAAVAVAGIETQQLSRGAVLVAHVPWDATLIVRADLTTLAESPELRPRTRVRFHLGTADVGARVVATGSPVAAGTTRAVRIALDEPVMARAGDRFVLRSASPLATIGGGVITDPNAPRRARPFATLGTSPEQRLMIFADEAGLRGVAESSLAIRLGLPIDDIPAAVKRAGKLTRVGERLYTDAALDSARAKLLELVKAHHAQRPLDPGASRPEIRSRLGIDQALFDRLVNQLVMAKTLTAVGAELRAAGFGPELNDQQTRQTEDIFAAIAQAGHEPPSVAELEARFGAQTFTLLKHLERQKRIIQVEDGRYYSPEAVHSLLERLEARMAGHGEVAPTDLREVLGFSRKFLIPFLEFCDKRGYTARQGNGRVWRGRPS
ncbi:MAG TPA: selenocysteine-specific translation elongation factor [Gemmatimonadaceae bacterium]|nr:selenocysteine-specific translation elongation factor [Gemmatimonadaceae bacterium]